MPAIFLCRSAGAKKTNTRRKPIGYSTERKENTFAMMQESSTPQTCPTSTLSAAASLVSLFLSQGNDLDLLTKEARSFMKSADWLKPGTLSIFCLRTCRGYSLTKGGKLSSLSSPRLGNWGSVDTGCFFIYPIVKKEKICYNISHQSGNCLDSKNES